MISIHAAKTISITPDRISNPPWFILMFYFNNKQIKWPIVFEASGKWSQTLGSWTHDRPSSAFERSNGDNNNWPNNEPTYKNTKTDYNFTTSFTSTILFKRPGHNCPEGSLSFSTAVHTHTHTHTGQWTTVLQYSRSAVTFTSLKPCSSAQSEDRANPGQRALPWLRHRVEVPWRWK